MKIKRMVFAGLGLVCFGPGTVGVLLPILPATPFYLLTLFFFANSSERLHCHDQNPTVFHIHASFWVFIAKTPLLFL